MSQKDEPIKNDPVKTEKTIYWSKARDSHLANFIPEKKSDSGRIIQDEISIVFTEHLYTTDDPKAIEHIEKSRAFNAKRIKKCVNGEEAAMLTAIHNKMRSGVVEVENIMDKDVYSTSSTG